MKTLSAILASLFLIAVGIEFSTPTVAGEDVATPAATPAGKEDKTIDCTKQVWPRFSGACLRNADQAIEVRVVTVSRR